MIATLSVWLAVMSAVALYCLVVGVLALRKRQFVTGIMGILCAVAVLSVPIQTHAVTLATNDRH